MTDKEVLLAYRKAVLEISVMEKQIARLGSRTAPRGYVSPRLDGMPRGTNDPGAAALQHLDGCEETLRTRKAELEKIVRRFEDILYGITDARLRVILRAYYGLGETDNEIAEEIGMSSRRINQLRNLYMHGEKTPVRSPRRVFPAGAPVLL